MIPSFNIDFNKLLSVFAPLLNGLIAYYVKDSVLEAVLVTAVTGALGAISVKAQTLDPAGAQLQEKIIQKGDTVQYESTQTRNSGSA